MNDANKRFILPMLGVGFLIWLLATLVFRLAGQFFFITESPVILTVLYLAVIPSLALISVVTFKKFKLSGLEHVVAGVLLVIPGMIIDTFVIEFFENIFPNMPASRAASFGSWLMWAYAVVLVTSLLIGLRQKKRPNLSDKMTTEQLTELAEKEKMLSKSELDKKLTELKSLNVRLLECILYVKVNQGCSLLEAKTIVVNSTAWLDQKEAFLTHQQEQMQEFLEYRKDDISEIKHTYSPDKTEIEVNFKPKK